MGRFRYTIGALIIAGAASAYAAGDASAGAKKVFQCQGCHGMKGYRNAFPDVYDVPKLGGQYAEYLVRSLQAYKKGERSHPTMRSVATPLTDQDMADIAAYYAGSAAAQPKVAKEEKK